MAVDLSETPTEEWLHDYGRNASFGELVVEVFRVGVALVDLFCEVRSRGN